MATVMCGRRAYLHSCRQEAESKKKAKNEQGTRHTQGFIPTYPLSPLEHYLQEPGEPSQQCHSNQFQHMDVLWETHTNHRFCRYISVSEH